MYKKVLAFFLLVCTLAKADLLSSACATLLGVPPSDVYDPLALPGGCVLNSCGTADGGGYFDIVCNILCEVALYSGGTCTTSGQSGPANIGSCTCHGGFGVPALLTPLNALCGSGIFGECVCTSCGYYNGATCSNDTNGINGTCNPN